MSKRGLIVVDLQNEYLASGKLPLVDIEAVSYTHLTLPTKRIV